jgi:hypothetical protein
VNFRQALIIATAVAIGISGCGQEGAPATSGSVITGPADEVLLVNPDSGRENFEMEALFEGTLELSAEKCVIGEDERGREVMLVFPADATFGHGEEPTVEVEGRSLAIGGPVSLGGGALSDEHLDRLTEVAPPGCFRDNTFYVQTIG